MITEQDKERAWNTEGMRTLCEKIKNKADPMPWVDYVKSPQVGAYIEFYMSKEWGHTSTHFIGINHIQNGEVVHAEIDFLWRTFGKDLGKKKGRFKAREKIVFYSTKTPCLSCSQAIVQANIKRVVCPEPHKINPNTGKPSKWFSTQQEGLHYLKQNGVTVDFVEVLMKEGIPYVLEDL